MSRSAAGLGAVVLTGLALSAGAFLSGALLPIAALALLVVAYLGVRHLYRPFGRIETQALRWVDGSTESMSELALPAEAGRAAAAVDAAMRALRGEIADLQIQYGDLNRLMDGLEEGVVAIDDARRLRVANRTAREILGVEFEGGPAPSASAIRSTELRAVLDTALQTAIRPREINVDGREILVQSRPVEGGAIVNLRDVTDVRRLEQVRTDFVANASHELKTPLTAVRGFAETLIDDPDAAPDIRRQFLGLIYDNTIRLQRIVEDLLDLSRLESGGWTPELEPVEVRDLAHDCWLSVCEASGTSRGFSVTGSGTVWADRQGLQHVVRNLMDNALRHTEADGSIRVDIRPARGAVAIDVADDGAGIPPDALPRIFERFFRVDKARSRAQGGTGLGLAIVSHLVSRMGGELAAESQFGVGTTIKIKLPEATVPTDVSQPES